MDPEAEAMASFGYIDELGNWWSMECSLAAVPDETPLETHVRAFAGFLMACGYARESVQKLIEMEI